MPDDDIIKLPDDILGRKHGTEEKIRYDNPKKEIYTCPECGLALTKKDWKHDHCKSCGQPLHPTIYKKVGPKKCPKCDHKLDKKERLESHCQHCGAEISHTLIPS